MLKALALILLSASSWGAALAPGTIALYFDSTKCSAKTVDGTGNNTLTQVGTVPYGDQGQPVGTSAAGPFSTSNYFRQNVTLPAAWLATADSWTVQGYIKAPNSAGYTIVGNDQAAGVVAMMLNVGSVGGSYFDNGAANKIDATVVADDTWNHFAWTWNGTRLKFYIDNVQIYDVAAPTGTITSGDGPVSVGIYQTLGSFALNGYLNQLRFMSTVETSFPTVDPAGNTNRSPYIDLFLYPEQGFLRRLLAPFVALTMPRNAEAHVQDQRVQQRVEEKRYIDWEVRTNRITKTRTLTPKATATPRIGSPTVTATATPTPDPSKITPTRTPSRVELEARER